MKGLLSSLNQLRKSKLKSEVDARMKEFKKERSSEEIFGELCYCLMTANFNAKRAMEIQEKIGKGFCELSEKKLAAQLKLLGHRYPNMRAKFIFEARNHNIKDILNSFEDEKELRNFLAENIKGLGYKEASHFLRNIGYDNLAIIDFHIIDILEKNRIIERPKTLTKKKYLEIENILNSLAKKANLTLSELDLYLWSMETGKVLK